MIGVQVIILAEEEFDVLNLAPQLPELEWTVNKP